MLYKILLALFASVLTASRLETAELVDAEVKIVEGVEAVDGCGTCGRRGHGAGFLGCGCGQNACLNPAIHYQNYQDVNLDVIEYYNFENSFPYTGNQTYAWTVLADQGGVYNNGLFTSTNSSAVWLLKNVPVNFTQETATYISMQADFLANGTNTTTSIDANPYYAYGSLYTVDADVTAMEYAFLLTNTRVYALYGRGSQFQTIDNNYAAFRYLVPIANTQPHSIYTLVFKRSEITVSWIIDGMVKMSIFASGRRIDSKFMIEDFGGDNQQTVYPDSVEVMMGISHLVTADPNSACQGPDAVFNYCDRTQNINNATQVQCTYAPVQDPTTYVVDSAMVVTMFSISDASTMKPACGCPCS